MDGFYRAGDASDANTILPAILNTHLSTMQITGFARVMPLM
jgi:hypothetical protein